MIEELHTVYRHTCDLCRGTVDSHSADTGGAEAPLLTLSSIIRGGQPVFSYSKQICADCTQKPLIEVLNALADRGSNGMLGTPSKERLLAFTPEQRVEAKEGGDA